MSIQDALPIPLHRLSAEALSSIIDEEILREGTDYGLTEVTFEEKRRQLRAALDRGDATIWFLPASQSCCIRHSTDG